MTSTDLTIAAEATQVQTGTVRVNGTEVPFHDTGAERAGTDPIMLVHGTGGSTTTHFPFLLPMLATAQRVISIDLVTPPAGGPDAALSGFVEQLAAVIEARSPGRPVTLVGYSLGAVVGVQLAATRPELVAKLVLIGGWMRTTTHQLLRNSVWLDLYALGKHETLARHQVFAAYSQPFLEARTPEQVEALVDRVVMNEETRAHMELNRRIDLTQVAPLVGCPTLVVAGTDDQMSPRRQSKLLFGAIEDARYTEVTAGHAMVAERPAELVHLVTNFNRAPHAFAAGSVIPQRRP